ncbi:HNH endonuclease signature motif containing protein [Microlunatus lacustris]
MDGGLAEAVEALDAARAVLGERLTELGLLPVVEQVAVVQQLEVVRNRVLALDLVVLAGLDVTDAAGQLCQGNLRRLLTSALGISRAEAGRRVHAYEQLGERRSMTGEPLGPVRPLLAAAVVAGEVSADKAGIITRALAGVDRPGFDPAEVSAGERLLTDDARTFGPEDLKRLAGRVVDAIDPDGTRPEEELQRDRRWFAMHSTPDGGCAGEFRLTAGCGAKLQALIRPLARVRVDESGDRDQRTFGQRQHDALEDLCDRLLRSGSVPDTGGVPVSVVVTIDEQDLSRRTGSATTSTGNLLSTRALLQMAAEADIIPAVLNASGAVLDLGRTRRCASRSQHLALVARDRGCSFPGCQHPAEFCERHHIRPWIEGGLTDLDNLTLLCRYHHHNFLGRGWQVRLNGDGLAEWIPPGWLDRQQRPLVNHRIRIAHDRPRRRGSDPPALRPTAELAGAAR